MSIQKNPTAPTNATKTVAGKSEADMIKEAWSFDEIGDIIIYVILGLNYAVSIVPIIGSLVVSLTRGPMHWFLIYDCVVKFLDMDKKAKGQPSIWNINNWLLYSLRRFFVEFFISILNTYTTAPLFFNWILNLIPAALSYVNLFVL